MQRSLTLGLVYGLTAITNTALAAPLILNKTEAVGSPRRDAGTGLCGSVVKFTNQAQPVGSVDEATVLLNRQMGDPNIVGRVSRVFPNMNLSIGAGSEGDFRAPTYPDEIFPYCTNAMSNPMGQSDNNIAMRIRGYLNVPDTMGGQPTTLALNCDDGCQLKIGVSKQVLMTADERSPVLTGRRARTVVFQDPGLYPIEVVYYQNATTGYLECSRGTTTPFGDDVAVTNLDWVAQGSAFKPLGAMELYSAVAGASSACQECDPTAATSCDSGNYCGDGICQTCNTAAHCGSSCAACPAGQNLCMSGKCMECTTDANCATSGHCDTATGLCAAPVPCKEVKDCNGAEVCRPEGFCGAPPTPCTSTSECQASQSCVCTDGSASCAQKLCVAPPSPCKATNECAMGYVCDTSAAVCKIDYRLYGGGLGCDTSNGARHSNTASHLALFAFALAAACAHLLRRRNA